MGISNSGGMIVGAHFEDMSLEMPEMTEEQEAEYDGSFAEYVCQEFGFQCMRLYFDCPEGDCIYGYRIADANNNQLTAEWLANIKTLCVKFESITGTPAKLIGVQNIT